MNSLWAPEHWDDFSIVGLLIFIVGMHFLAYFRGWIVPGPHHREIVAARDRQIAGLEKRVEEDAKTIHVQAVANAKSTVGTDAAKQLLESVREIAERTQR